VSDAPNRAGDTLLGLQTWVALPENQEEIAPSFAHYDAAQLPVIEAEGIRLKLILGAGFGIQSPVATRANPFYAECRLQNKAQLSIPSLIEERSVYLLSGGLVIDGQRFAAGTMIIFTSGKEALVEAEGEALFMLIGGERLEKPRFMWWNFVSSSAERIETAKEDWREMRFAMIPGETEFVPLPKNEAVPRPQPL
jgi:redox-sensitive bicupin YhaK (pirin superfamily)